MKVLITGVKGQLGYDLVRECNKRGVKAVGGDIEEMDITNQGKGEEAMGQSGYDNLIHCAVWRAVDSKKFLFKVDCLKTKEELTKNGFTPIPKWVSVFKGVIK